MSKEENSHTHLQEIINTTFDLEQKKRNEFKNEDIHKHKSHNSRVPYLALSFFISVFAFSIAFILLYFFGIDEISFFGYVILSKNDYFSFLNAIITTTDLTNLWNNNPLAFIAIIVIFILIVAVIVKFISAFREPITEFDSNQTVGSVTYFNFTKKFSRTRAIFIKPTNDHNSDIIKDFTGTVFNFNTDAKTSNSVYCVPDKRNSKSDTGNFFLEFPECFPISDLRNYMSEHSWITIATNIATMVTITILTVGTLLNIVLNIITQAQLNPYLIFGITSWISLSAVISISAILIWALREIKGLYGVFRIIRVSKSPLDVDRYLVIPYYYDGISGAEINKITETFLTFNKTKKMSLLPVLPDYTSNDHDNLTESDAHSVTEADGESEVIDFSLSDSHTAEYYVTEIDQLKSRIKTLEMDKDRALLLVNQLADDNTNLKKIIRVRKSIDYSNFRSLNALQDNSPPLQNQVQVEHVHTQGSQPSGKQSNHILTLFVIGIIGAIAIYWASITFTPTEFLILIVVAVLLVVVIILVIGILVFRQYMNESSSGKRINFG